MVAIFQRTIFLGGSFPGGQPGGNFPRNLHKFIQSIKYYEFNCHILISANICFLATNFTVNCALVFDLT